MLSGCPLFWMLLSFIKQMFSLWLTFAIRISFHNPYFSLLYQLHFRLLPQVSSLIALNSPCSGGRCILSLLIQLLLVFSIKASMSVWISDNRFFGQTIIDSKYPSWEIRKVFEIIRFPIVDRFSFLQIAIFCLIFSFLSSKFSLSFINLLLGHQDLRQCI